MHSILNNAPLGSALKKTSLCNTIGLMTQGFVTKVQYVAKSDVQYINKQRAMQWQVSLETQTIRHHDGKGKSCISHTLDLISYCRVKLQFILYHIG